MVRIHVLQPSKSIQTCIDNKNLDDLTDEQRRAYMLVHNKLTMNTDFDFELLDSELGGIIDIDMSEFGFDIEIEEEEPDEIIDDEVPEEVETRCKLGDIWQLGSDMGDAVTGGGLHGKDLSKADVSLNIYAHIRANQTGQPVELYCAIGDEYVDGLPYSAIVEVARDYIFNHCGGFEKFAEWGLI